MADPIPASDTAEDPDVAFFYTENSTGGFRKADTDDAKAALGLGPADSPQFTAINLGHATDTTITRVSAGIVAIEGNAILDVTDIGAIVQPFDANTAFLDVPNQVVTGGAEITSLDLGTISSGTGTLDLGDCPMQHYVNGGAHTLAPGSVPGMILLDIVNNGSAGAITTSGWTKVTGDTLSTTNGHVFRCHCSLTGGYSLLSIQAMQ